MNLDHLCVFLIAAKHLNLTKAAAELHLSQSAVSKQLKRLEATYDMKLFRRMGNGIELTQPGERFLREGQGLLSATVSFHERWNPKSKAASQHFSVAGSHGPSGSLLPHVISIFNRTHPQVQVFLRTAPRHIVEQLVLKSEVEVGVVTTAPKSSGLVVEPLRREELVAFVSVCHPLARKRKITLSDIAKTPFVVRGQSGVKNKSAEILEKLKAMGVAARIGLTCDLPSSVKAGVAKSMGIGLLYRDGVAPEIRSGEFKIIRIPQIEMDGQSFIIVHKDRPPSPCGQKFLALLRAWRDRNCSRNGNRLRQTIKK